MDASFAQEVLGTCVLFPGGEGQGGAGMLKPEFPGVRLGLQEPHDPIPGRHASCLGLPGPFGHPVLSTRSFYHSPEALIPADILIL